MENLLGALKVLGSIFKWASIIIVVLFGLLSVVVCLCAGFDKDEEDEYHNYNYDDMECIPPKEEREVPNYESEEE